MSEYPIPTGTRDVLSDELKELRALTAKLREVFARHGYDEVSTPTLEYEKVLTHGDVRTTDSSYRVIDENGNVLVLRPDMTVPIARMVATRFANVDPPFRFSTIGRTYGAVRPLRGQLKESLQAGIELIGAEGEEANVEVLTVLCEALKNAGLDELKVGIGDARLYRTVLANLGVPEAAVLHELETRDLVGLEREINALGLDESTVDLLVSLPRLRGGPETLDRAAGLHTGEQFMETLGSLRRCFELLDEKGCGETIIFDLGLVRDLGYYTGIVFEIYDPSQGLMLGGGGRYDDLLGRFGRDLPAVGFDISVENLHTATVR